MPMAFGVLTTDTWEQAEERAVDGRENKGWEAAAAAIEMAALFRRLRDAVESAVGRSLGSMMRCRRRRDCAARAQRRCRCSTNGRSVA